MKKFRALRQGETLALGLAGILAYWAASPFINNDPQVEWIRVFQIVFSFAVVMGFLNGLVSILRRPAPILAQRYIVGTVLTWSGIFGGAAWLLLWRLAGLPQWMIRAEINGFWIWLVFLGAVFHLAAIRRAADEDIIDTITPFGPRPRADWKPTAVAIMVSILVGIILMTNRPDARAVADFLKPYLADKRDLVEPHAGSADLLHPMGATGAGVVY